LSGSGSQTFYNLTVDKSGGLVVMDPAQLVVIGTLDVKSGSFTSNGGATYQNVTVESGASLILASDIRVNGNWMNHGNVLGHK
jgi:hypothetical protein